MDDLEAFLRARLDEDEAAAKDKRIWFGPYPQDIGEFEGHLVIWDERVAREVAAKRAILDTYALFVEVGGPAPDPYRAAYRAVVGVLAAVYSGHPDYRDEWKP